MSFRRFTYTYTREEWSDWEFRDRVMAECREIARNNAPSEVLIKVRDGRAKPATVVTIKAKG